MAWYYGTFSCGHEGRTNIIGPSKNRQYIADRRFSGLCEECYSKWLEEEKERKNKESLEAAKEMELPELTGTEKQITWALTLRQNLINKFEELIKLYAKREEERSVEDLTTALNYILENKIEAKYYIDNRYESAGDLAIKANTEIYENSKKQAEKVESKEVIKEGTITPVEVKFDGVAEININEKKISVRFEKNQIFISIVKSLGYKWNGIWEKEIKETVGSYKDRAAELGNKLLNNGFAICILDEEIRTKAINADYEVECKRWIYPSKDNSNLAISWNGRNEKLYNASRRLPGSKWNSPYVFVKISHYKEVEEFAEMYGFKFTQKAINLIKDYKIQLENIEVVDVVKFENKPLKDGLNDILSSSREVLDDLKED